MKSWIACSGILSLAFAVGGAFADEKDTRAGSCEDAQKQIDYFCNESNSAADTMVLVGTACNNAKNNAKAACEGIVEPDKVYEFDDKKAR
jgi:hypothetical protein